jgi:hypothetical protein
LDDITFEDDATCEVPIEEEIKMIMINESLGVSGEDPSVPIKYGHG